MDSLHKVLFEAIFNRESFAVKDCEGSFFLLGDLTFRTKNGLAELEEAAFENLRKSGTGN